MISNRKILTFCIALSVFSAWAYENTIYKEQIKTNKGGKVSTHKSQIKNNNKTDSIDKANSYKDIVDGASISKGMFDVVQKKEDYYFRIPTTLLGRDMLVVNKLRRVPKELNEAGVNRGVNYENKMIRLEWDKSKNALLIRESRPLPERPEERGISIAVEDNYISPLIASLKVEGVSSDSTSILVKVNALYDGSETSLNNVFDNINLGTSAIKDLSRIQRIKTFENNVVGYSELTTKVREGNTSVHVTVEVHSTIMLLPKEVLPGRQASVRVGYFSVPYLHYSDNQHRVEHKDFITRWRLEPREEDKSAYLSGTLVDPKKPIVFYIDDSTPKPWRKYIKEGIEAWQIAFERAGFKQAIQAKELPDSVALDADDISYSLVTYVASEKKNAMGPSLIDPRSGEILEADIIWWHNVMTMLREWIMVQTGTTDERAKGADIPEELMGDAIRFVACHEVGHSLGLRHNMIASHAISVDSLRSPHFTEQERLTSASIMDYARFNYVAQPEDGVKHLKPGIGEYDKFAIEYGYRWYGDKESDDVKPLNAFLKAHQDTIYRYSEAQDTRDAVDPRAQTEDLGDDAIKASSLGISNLKRIVPEIIKRTTTGEDNQSYERASELYYGIIYQWNNYLYHVLANVGGIYIEHTTVGDGKQTYTFVPRDKQREAAKWLIDEVFTYPKWLFGAEVGKYTYLLRQTPNGLQENAPSQILQNTQSYLLWDMLANHRLMRMMEAESQLGSKNSYTAVMLLSDLTDAIFGRYSSPDARERSLQKNMVDALLTATAEVEAVKVNKKISDSSLPIALSLHDPWCREGDRGLTAAPRKLNFYGSQLERISDAISAKRGALLRIRELAQRRMLSLDKAVRYHYQDIVLRINTALGIHEDYKTSLNK